MKSKLIAKFLNYTLLELVFMKEVHISAFDSWQKFDNNMCEATGSQRPS
jgi:hypothetical protein